MTTTELFIWSIDSEGNSYPSEFTEAGRAFVADAMEEIVNENLPFNITSDIADTFLLQYEEGCMINNFKKDDSLKEIIGKILEDFYKDILESTKESIGTIDCDVDKYLEHESFSYEPLYLN